jgi:hypothetical protein
MQFQLSRAEARSVVRKFRSRAGYDPGIFKKVQETLAELERQAMRYPAVSSAHTETRLV